MSRKERKPVTEPLLDILGGKLYAVTALGSYSVYGKDRSFIGAEVGSPLEYTVVCSGYPRKFVVPTENMGGRCDSGMYNKTLHVPFTSSGRALVQNVLAVAQQEDPPFLVSGVGLRAERVNYNEVGKRHIIERSPLPAATGVRVGRPQHRDHEQLHDLPGMPLDLNALPLDINALEELYVRVVKACVEQGRLVDKPETDEERNAFEASVLLFDADQEEQRAARMVADRDELNGRIREALQRAGELRIRARELHQLPLLEE